MANVKTFAKELDFRTGGATRYQKLTGDMPPVPPALTEGLYMSYISRIMIKFKNIFSVYLVCKYLQCN